MNLNKTRKFAVLDVPGVKQPAAPVAAPVKGPAAVASPEINEEDLYTSPLSVEEKVAIAMSVGEETLTVEELSGLYRAKAHPVVYDGFEPSGRMHIAQ
eukprot:gene45359-55499_t